MASRTSEQIKPTNERLKLFLDEWQSIEPSSTDSGPFSGGNNATKAIVFEQNGTSHLIPANCNFFNANVTNIQHIDLASAYDLVVMDPPWWNKYVRRSRKRRRDNG